MHIGFLPLVLAALLFSPAHKLAQPITEKALLGGWMYVSGDTEFEQMAFEMDGKQRVFHSWLHERPEHTGTWELKGDYLAITIPENPDFSTNARILSITEKKLKIQFEGDEKPAIFKRVP
jgi:hypothetical protein